MQFTNSEEFPGKTAAASSLACDPGETDQRGQCLQMSTVGVRDQAESLFHRSHL
jgi:hypothetical protein